MKTITPYQSKRMDTARPSGCRSDHGPAQVHPSDPSCQRLGVDSFHLPSPDRSPPFHLLTCPLWEQFQKSRLGTGAFRHQHQQHEASGTQMPFPSPYACLARDRGPKDLHFTKSAGGLTHARAQEPLHDHFPTHRASTPGSTPKPCACDSFTSH